MSGYVKYCGVKLPRGVWNEMQLDAMPEYRACPGCGNGAQEEVDRSHDLEAELEQDIFRARVTWVCHYCGREDQELEYEE